ncbi:hypothetical protein CAEBREN_07222 [Caenorhabditis brenneri]|uniref:BRCT domain-containing protein n=1 Tax=Caenorhabditis brenneri TaxID=135651 RepID=G0PN08_CAEBE|nr:hypothetical protein CAEBREN_07222 [Caenorhabditis brenneri]
MNNQSSLSGLLTENQEKSALESMKSNIQNISDCMDSFEDYQEFTDPILEQGKIFQKVVYARDMFKKLKESTYNYSEYSTQLENVRKMISLTLKDFKKPKLKLHEQIETTIQLFKDLRNKLLIPERTLTVGFGNFGTLREDIRSEWFKSKISKQKSTVILENALKQFMEFGVLVDEMWTTFMEYRATFNSDQNTRDMLWVANVWKKIDEFEDWKGDEFLNRATTELLATTTHIIVKTDANGILELDRLQILIWILSGVILVKESWMTDCLNDSKIIDKDYNYLVEKVRYKGIVYSTVTQWTEALAKGAMPYLYGVYVVVTIPEYTNYPAIASIVTAHGGTVLEGFPEKHQYNIGTHPYLHANLGPFFVIHDGKRDLKYYKNHRDKMYTLFTEEEFVRFLLKREIHRDTRVNLNSVMIDGED